MKNTNYTSFYVIGTDSSKRKFPAFPKDKDGAIILSTENYSTSMSSECWNRAVDWTDVSSTSEFSRKLILLEKIRDEKPSGIGIGKSNSEV